MISYLSRISAVAFVAAALLASQAQASPANCGQVKPVNVSVTSSASIPEYTVITAHSAVLAEKHGEKHVDGGHAGRIEGLISMNVARRVATDMLLYRAKDGFCAVPAKIGVELIYPKAEIFIDRGIPVNSCKFKAILAHELEHYKINSAVMRESAEKVKETLAVAAKAGKLSVYGATQEEANLALRKAVADVVSAEEESLLLVRKQRNASLDTPESYAAVRRSCKTW